MNGSADQKLALFTEALQLPAHERAAHLERACGGDVELRQAVEALLQEHGQVGDFLETSPNAPLAKEKAGTVVAERAGDYIGGYKLLRQIGEGGCGIVFMAEQTQPVRRKVALKIIKPGMDTKSVIARFEAERQALALMDHPNIARIFDAGATQSGRPFFVMELVRGLKITDYCDRLSLATSARLTLFAQVCEAVQHAHQKGIIHRDIKPSNVLVTTGPDGKPEPKVIDFGVAKATDGQQLTDKTIVTAHEMLIGTPDYMSPEQAARSSAELDTRTDIYSLGALLYELLMGATPFDTRELLKAGIDEVRRVIREKEPLRPSTRLTTMPPADLASFSKRHGASPQKLIREMRGELDWVVMKALEKNRERRYQTAESFAADIHRYLGNEAVSARPPSRLYRFRKFASRHKLGLTAFGIVMMTLVTGLTGTNWALAKEKREHQVALTEAARSKEVTEFLKRMLAGVDPAVAAGHDTTLLRGVLDDTVESMGRELTNQPAVEADLKAIIGSVYGSLGLYDKGVAQLRSALGFYGESPADAKEKMADALSSLSIQNLMRSKFEEAEQEAREAFAIDPSLRVGDSMRRMQIESRLGWVIMRRDRPAEAEPIFRRALAMGERLVPEDSEQLLETKSGLAVTLNLLDRLPEAENLLRNCLEVDQKVYGLEHPYAANDMYRLEFVLGREHKFSEAEAFGRRCLAIRRKALGPDHPLFDQALSTLAQFLSIAGKPKESADGYRELLEIRRKRLGDENSGVAEAVTALTAALVDSHNDVQFEALARDFPKAWITRSEDLAESCRWSEASAAASNYLALYPDDPDAYHLMAPLLVQMQEFRAYQELCDRITSRFAGSTNPYTADRMAKDCLVLPRAGADLTAPGQLAETAVTLGQQDAGALPFFQCCKALAEFRLGNWSAAVDWAQRATNSVLCSRAEASAVLAMSLFQLKQTEASREALKKCSDVVDNQLPKFSDKDLGRDWRDWIIAHALQSEAKRMIEGEPAAVGPTLPPPSRPKQLMELDTR